MATTTTINPTVQMLNSYQGGGASHQCIPESNYPYTINFKFNNDDSRELFKKIIESKDPSVDAGITNRENSSIEYKFDLYVNFIYCKNPKKVYEKYLAFLGALPKAKEEINSP